MGGAPDPPRWLGRAVWCWSPCCLSLSPSLPLCPYPACPPLVCPCPAPASSRLSLPLSLFCPGPILLCPQLHPACLAPVCLRFVFCPSLLWPHPACPHSILLPSCPSLSTSCLCPSRFDLLPNLPVPTLPCSHPVCPHPILSPSCLSYPKRSTRMEWEVPCSGPSCILPGQGQLRWDFPSIDWISCVLGEFYLTAAGGCEVTVTVGMLQPVPYGAE